MYLTILPPLAIVNHSRFLILSFPLYNIFWWIIKTQQLRTQQLFKCPLCGLHFFVGILPCLSKFPSGDLGPGPVRPLNWQLWTMLWWYYLIEMWECAFPAFPLHTNTLAATLTLTPLTLIRPESPLKSQRTQALHVAAVSVAALQMLLLLLPV